MESGKKHEKLVASKDVPLLPLYIKQGLIKQFVKVMNSSGKGFTYFTQKFSRLSAAETKEGRICRRPN